MTIAFIELTFEDGKCALNTANIVGVSQNGIRLVTDTFVEGYKETYAEVIQMIRQVGVVRSTVDVYGGYND